MISSAVFIKFSFGINNYAAVRFACISTQSLFLLAFSMPYTPNIDTFFAFGPLLAIFFNFLEIQALKFF